MSKKIGRALLSLVTMVAALAFPMSALAFDPACMLCVFAVGTGLGIGRMLGIPDLLVGVWAGGLFWAAGTWSASLLVKKLPKIKYLGTIWLVIFYTILLVALMLVKLPVQLGSFKENLSIFDQAGQIIIAGQLVNPLAAGMVFGTIVMIAGISLDKYLRGKKEDGKAFFPFQKVLVPLACLLIGTLLAWLLTID